MNPFTMCGPISLFSPWYIDPSNDLNHEDLMIDDVPILEKHCPLSSPTNS